MPTSYHKIANKNVTMTPNGCGAATYNIKNGEGRIREATTLRAMKSSSRTHLLVYHLSKMQLTMILLQGYSYPLFLMMMLVNGKLDGESLVRCPPFKNYMVIVVFILLVPNIIMIWLSLKREKWVYEYSNHIFTVIPL